MKSYGTFRTIALAAVTPLLEKNVSKTRTVDAPLVLSMSRVIVFAFAIGTLRHVWRTGVDSWPAAALAIAVVLALPVLGALDRVAPDRVVALAEQVLVGREGGAGQDSQV